MERKVFVSLLCLKCCFEISNAKSDATLASGLLALIFHLTRNLTLSALLTLLISFKTLSVSPP